MDVVATPAARPGLVRVGVGWVPFGATLLLAALAITLTLGDGRSLLAGDLPLGCELGIGLTLLGAFILSRHPGHPMGWLFAASGLSRILVTVAEAWCVRALVARPGALPWGELASWVQAWGHLPLLAFAPMTVVLFPDGRLPGPRWRVVPVLAGAVVVLGAVVVPIAIWPYRGPLLLPDAPVPDTPRASFALAVVVAGIVLTVVAVLLALVAVVARARRCRGEVRQQLKWFGYGAGCALTLELLSALPGLTELAVLSPIPMLTGIGLGIFRYRLYDVDRLIKRTLVYGAITAVLVGGFATVDITLATILGRNTVVAAASAFVVAIALRPVRDAVQDLVDRVFDRRTHDAVAILRALGQRVGREPVEPATVIAALQHALRDPDLKVYYYTGSARVLVDGAGRRADPIPTGPDQVSDPVTRNGEQVALIVHAPADPVLVHAVVRSAAPVLEHARLQAALLVQLAEVRASRARLAAAGDAERRRIERDLHDGAQQRLVGLALHVQSAKRRGAYPPDVAKLLTFTVEQLSAAVEEIRALVHGILPPALTAGGLPAVLPELARPGAVTVSCAIPHRLDPGIEATAWFVACEAVANAAKHAPGHLAHV